MPRNVRNSWVDIDVDGRVSSIGAGPEAKHGTMTAQFYVRNEGMVQRSVRVDTYVDGNRLALEVRDPHGNVVFRHETKRQGKGKKRK